MSEDKGDSSPCTLQFDDTNGCSGNIHTKSLQRDQIMTTFKKMSSNINSFYQLSVFQLEVKLSSLERLMNSFEKVQSDLESLDESEITKDHRAIVEEAYYEVKSIIFERLAFHRGNNLETPLSSTRVAGQNPSLQRPVLPTLQLTKFSGNNKDWMEFYNVFCQLVHENHELSPVSKFQYLKSCLAGNAARLIQSLAVTSENYEVAFDLLKARYNNKHQLFQSHLLELFNIQRINKPSVSSLRLFIDNVNSSMRALESIATKAQIAENIILHLIVSKLDIDLQTKWEESQSLNTTSSTLCLPSWDKLANFLENRCKSLEIYESNHITPHRELQQKQHRNNRSFTSKPQTTSYISSNHIPKCNICQNAPHHNIFRCPKFVDMNIHDRFNTAKRLKLCLNCLGTNHIASSCPSLNRCQKCNATHHTLLHKEKLDEKEASRNITAGDDSSPTACLQISRENSPVILATAIVELYSPNGTSMLVRALLDSCSQSNFITEHIAQRLKLPRRKVNISICGIGGATSVCAKYSCSFIAKSLTCEYAPTLDAIIISSISSYHPQQHINTSFWKLPQNIRLADKNFNVPAAVDLLIGVDLFWDILMVGKIKGENHPNLIKTKLGWIVSGSMEIPGPRLLSPQVIAEKQKGQKTVVLVTKNNDSVITEGSKIAAKYNQQAPSLNEPLLDNLLQSFWKIESCEGSEDKMLTKEEETCEQFFKDTTKRCPKTDKFIVRLPFKIYPPDLGNSQGIARLRFTYLEARLARDKLVQKDYIEFLEEYRSLDHMVAANSDNARYYIPHHCVVKPDSSTTRLRVVFDASCATSNGKSLNQMLHIGPNLQNDLFSIQFRFRLYKFVLVADIAKMYRQVLVHDDDKKWQCILWRKHINEALLTYELQTVTYGTSCAPYLAVKCLQQLAKEEVNAYPIGSCVALRDFYVDNLMTGGNSEKEVIELKKQVTALSVEEVCVEQ